MVEESATRSRFRIAADLHRPWVSGPATESTYCGASKDRGGKGDKDAIDAKDIDNLKRVADALPRKRFETFIALVKLCPFTADEIALARTLNDPYRLRAILLTAQELEPYHFYERTKLEF